MRVTPWPFSPQDISALIPVQSRYVLPASLTLPSHWHGNARNLPRHLPSSVFAGKKITTQRCKETFPDSKTLLGKHISMNKLMRITDGNDRIQTQGKQFKPTVKENRFQSCVLGTPTTAKSGRTDGNQPTWK